MTTTLQIINNRTTLSISAGQGLPGVTPFFLYPDSLAWDENTAYVPRSAVNHGLDTWIARVANTGVEPGTDNDVWRVLIPGADADAVAAAAASAQAAADDAAALVDAANTTVSTVAANFSTKAALDLVASGYANGAGVNIYADGANNGFWVKVSGTFAQQSTATISSLDLRAPTTEDIPGSGQITRDADRGISWRVLNDGTLEIAVLLAHAADLKNLSALALSTKGLALLNSDGAVAKDTALAGAGLGEVLVDSSGGILQAIIQSGYETPVDRNRLSFQRSRSCANDGVIIESVPRSAGSENHDLVAINRTSGTVVPLTSDEDDLFDFADPSISGSHCLYSRWRGGMRDRRAVPLAGGSPIRIDSLKSFHFLGDSFIGNLSGSGGIVSAFAPLVSPVQVTWDGVGGSTLTDQYGRFQATPWAYDSTLLIWDGGLDSDQSTALAMLANISSLLRPLNKRWAYIEAGTYSTASSEEKAARAATIAAIEAAYPHNFISMVAWLQSKNDGSPEDLADVAAGLVPRSLRAPGDPIHLTWGSTSSGQYWAALKIIADVQNKGWLS